MKLIDLDALDKHQLYIIAGGDGYTIPYGLYKCDGYAATEGTPVELFNLEEYDLENRNKLIQTILENKFTIAINLEGMGEETIDYEVVDTRDIKDVADMYDFINGNEFKKFLYEEQEKL